MRFQVSRVMDAIEQRLTTDVIAAQAVVDLGAVARYVALDGGRPVNLLRIGMVLDALGRYLLDGGALLYPVVGRELLSEASLTSKERMVLGRWADDGLIEVTPMVTDRPVEIADFTGVPLIVVGDYGSFTARFPWLADSPERVLRLSPRAGGAVLRPEGGGEADETMVHGLAVGKAAAPFKFRFKVPLARKKAASGPVPAGPVEVTVVEPKPAKSTPSGPAEPAASRTPTSAAVGAADVPGAGPGKRDAKKSEPAKSEPTNAEPAKAEPAKAEPAKADAGRADAGTAGAAKSDPAKSAPAKADAAKSGAEQSLASEPPPGAPDASGDASGEASGESQARATESAAAPAPSEPGADPARTDNATVSELPATGVEHVEEVQESTEEEAAATVQAALDAFALRGAVRVSSTRVVRRRFTRADPSGVGGALMAREWRCPERDCPVFGTYRRIGQPVPRMRGGVPACPRHAVPLRDVGPRPPAYAVCVVVDDLARRRFVVNGERPVTVGSRPEDPDGVSLAEWLHEAAASWIAAEHLRLAVQDGQLVVTDDSDNGTLVWKRSGPDDPGQTTRLYRQPYVLDDWDSVELYTGVELIRADRRLATVIRGAEPLSVLLDAPTVAMVRPNFR